MEWLAIAVLLMLAYLAATGKLTKLWQVITSAGG